MEVEGQLRWHHWALTGLVSAWLLVLAVPMVLHGADASSRFFEFDDPIVRILGVLLLVAAPALLFRWRWAFFATRLILALMVIETAVTFDPAASSVPATFVLGFTVFAIVLPVLIVTWLRSQMVPAGGR